jgi:hypothetical protein
MFSLFIRQSEYTREKPAADGGLSIRSSISILSVQGIIPRQCLLQQVFTI